MQRDVQREEGVGDGVNHNQDSSPSSKTQEQGRQEVSIIGMYELSSSSKLLSQEMSFETKKAELDKARFQSANARGNSLQCLLPAIKPTKEILLLREEEVEIQTYKNILNSLY